jgi:hypothetical protein
MGSDVNGSGTESDNRVSLDDDQQLFAQLDELWRANRRRDLETRHRTGVLLNERLGPPTNGQPYGRGVLKQVGERYKLAQSDISRMRRFASHFVDVDRFQQEYPEVNRWTEIKELLPDLKPRKGGEAKDQPVSPSSRALRGVIRSLTRLTGKLRGMESIPEGKLGEDFRKKLQKLIEVATERLGVHAPSPALETDSSPGDPARANDGDRCSG